MIWGRPKYLLFLTSCLVLSDTGLSPRLPRLSSANKNLVWGYVSLGSNMQALSEPDPWPLFIYLWSVFAINILISGITGKSR